MSALVVALVLLLAACGNGESAEDGNGSNGGEAASVNGEEIAAEGVESRFESLASNPQFAQQLEADESGAMEAQLQSELLTQMIQVELMEQGADELGVEVSDEDLEEQRAEIEQQLEDQGTDLETAMEQQGLDADDLEEELRAAALQEALAAELSGDDEVTDDEVAQYFDENTEQFATAEIRHLVVESEEAATEAVGRVEDGEDFAAVAEDVGGDGQAAQGGEAQEVTSAELQMVPALQQAVFEEGEAGDVVGPVDSEQGGWHVVEIIERNDPELADVEEEIRTELGTGQEFQALDEWLAEQTSEADIEVAAEYGEWDPEAGQVMPDIEEGQQPMPGQAPQGDQQAPQGGQSAPDGGGSGSGGGPSQEEIEELEQQLQEQMEQQGGDEGGGEQ